MLRSRALQLGLLSVFTATFQTACDWMPGKPDPNQRPIAPEAITDFDTLYAQNCIACHGAKSQPGPAIAMDNATYLHLIPADVLKNTIANGIPGTRMPGFAESHGGGLTDAQIDIVTQGILAWKKPLDPASSPLPAYAAPLGDAARGQSLFDQSFAKGLPSSETYLDPAFLGLVSDQYLRTLVIVGQPDLGYPDFRQFIPSHALTDQEVSDVVAWLVSNRKNEYGQPIALPTPPTPTPTSP